jgi:hypothetical protein
MTYNFEMSDVNAADTRNGRVRIGGDRTGNAGRARGLFPWVYVYSVC